MRFLPLIKRFLPIPGFKRQAPVDPIQTEIYSANVTARFAISGTTKSQLYEPIMGDAELPQPLLWPFISPMRWYHKACAKFAMKEFAKTNLMTPAPAEIAIDEESTIDFHYAQSSTARFSMSGNAKCSFGLSHLGRLHQEDEEFLILGIL